MIPGRFTDLPVETSQESQSAKGFLLIAVPANNLGTQSTMQWFYQRLYEEAAKVSQPPAPSRDLFKVMN